MKFTAVKNELIKEAIYKGEHESGLSVAVLPKERFSKKYAVISTKYGSIDSSFKTKNDNEYVTVPDGIAHFLEHKMFEQPDETNAFDKFSQYGANANAYTSFGNTAYLFSCTSMFNESLDHLLNYVFSPHFTDENVEKEQGIIGQEISMYEDDPDWRVFFNMLCGMYHTHPIKQDIAGTAESISKIDKDLLYHCYNTFYHPGNMVLFIAGYGDLDKISEIINKNVKTPSESFFVDRMPTKEPPSVVKSMVTQKLTVSIPMFACGFKDSIGHISGKELAKRNLLMHILVKLFASESSDLYQTLYDSGLINDTFYEDVSMSMHYSFVQLGGESREPEKVRDMILKEIARIKQTGIPEEAYLRMKKFMYGKYVKTFNSIESVGNSYCGNYFAGIDLFDFLDVYDTITYSEACKLFDEVFDESRLVLSVIYPQGG